MKYIYLRPYYFSFFLMHFATNQKHLHGNCYARFFLINGNLLILNHHHHTLNTCRLSPCDRSCFLFPHILCRSSHPSPRALRRYKKMTRLFYGCVQNFLLIPICSICRGYPQLECQIVIAKLKLTNLSEEHVLWIILSFNNFPSVIHKLLVLGGITVHLFFDLFVLVK